MECRTARIVRYSSAGVLDQTFGDSGIAVNPKPQAAGPGTEQPYVAGLGGLVVLRDGRILVSATVVASDPSQSGPALLRYTDNGQPDTTFGTQGLQLTNGLSFTKATPTGGAGFLGVAPSPTGAKYWDVSGQEGSAESPGRRAERLPMSAVAGVVTRSSNALVVGSSGTHFVHVRFGLGVIGSYNANGRTSVAVPNVASLEATTMRAGHSGRIYVGAIWAKGTAKGFVIAAFRQSGQHDAGFGRRGFLRLGGASASMAIARDGRLAVVTRSGREVLVRRFTSEGKPDRSFPPVRVRLNVEEFTPVATTIDAADRIMILGSARDLRSGKRRRLGAAFVRLVPVRPR